MFYHTYPQTNWNREACRLNSGIAPLPRVTASWNGLVGVMFCCLIIIVMEDPPPLHNLVTWSVSNDVLITSHGSCARPLRSQACFAEVLNTRLENIPKKFAFVFLFSKRRRYHDPWSHNGRQFGAKRLANPSQVGNCEQTHLLFCIHDLPQNGWTGWKFERSLFLWIWPYVAKGTLLTTKAPIRSWANMRFRML